MRTAGHQWSWPAESPTTHRTHSEPSESGDDDAGTVEDSKCALLPGGALPRCTRGPIRQELASVPHGYTRHEAGSESDLSVGGATPIYLLRAYHGPIPICMCRPVATDRFAEPTRSMTTRSHFSTPAGRCARRVSGFHDTSHEISNTTTPPYHTRRRDMS